MIKRSLVLINSIIIIFFTISMAANASWVYFSVEDLQNKSDVIVIGQLKGKVGERKSEKNFWNTQWKIEVYYYLKGNVNTKELIVSTPGARNKSVATSIDYYLDEWESKTLLLFLHNVNGSYSPLSPQGVVALTKNEYTPIDLTGKEILKQISINDSAVQEQKSNLINLLEGSPYTVPTLTEASSESKGSSTKSNNNYYLIYAAGIAALLTIIAAVIKKR